LLDLTISKCAYVDGFPPDAHVRRRSVPNPTTTVIAVVDADSSQYPDGTSSSTSKGGTSSIQTADGTVRVQRFRSSRSKKLRAMITFTPRTSAFDRENASSGNDPFRGFFTLFWICVFIFIVRTYVTYYETSGYPLSLAFATLFSKDAKTLALSDAVLVSSTGLSVLFVKLIQKGWIRYYWTGVIIQHVYQAVMLGVAVQWTFNRSVSLHLPANSMLIIPSITRRQWPWVQSGFFTLHCLVMLMKVHSYVAINGYLSWVFKSQIETIKTLREACEAPSIGGYEKAIQVAKVEKEKLEEKEKLLNGVESNTTGSSPAPGTPALLHEQPVSTSYDSTLSSNLRQRLLNVPARQSPDITSSSSPPTSNTLGSTTPSYFPNQPEDPVYEHPLVYHPDEIIQTLAQSITDMEAELCSMGKKRVRWPDNISLYNFMDYQLIPTLVYELEYPRTERLVL
jgi:sterol O-acyltransferase